MEIVKLHFLKNFLNKSSFFKRIFIGTIWMSVGNVMSRILISFSFVFLAHILTKQDYGLFSMLKSTVDSFLIFATAGLSITSTKFVAELKNDVNKLELSEVLSTIFFIAFFIGLLISSLVFFFSSYIANSILNNSSLEEGLKISGITLFFASYNAIQLGALIGFEEFKKQMIVNLVQGISIGVFVSLGGYFFNYYGAILGFLFSLILTVVVNFFLLKKSLVLRGVKINLLKPRKRILTVLKFTVPVFFSAIITSPVLWLLNAFLVRMPKGFESLGVYNAVYVFPSIILLLNSVIGNAILPVVLSVDKLNKNQEIFSYLINWFICIYISLFFASFPEIISIVLGDKYSITEINSVLIFSLASILLISHRQGIARNLVKKNKMIYSVYSMGQWAITTLLIFNFLKELGALGLAMSLFIGYLINTVIFVPFFIKKEIAPRSIFFNKFKIIIFLLSYIFLFFNLIEGIHFVFRVSIFLIEIMLISFVIVKLYRYDVD